MSSDSAGLTDEVHVTPNGTSLGQPAALPGRPADSATKGKWAAYVVALGLHPDEADNYTRDELIALADRFGG